MKIYTILSVIFFLLVTSLTFSQDNAYNSNENNNSSRSNNSNQSDLNIYNTELPPLECTEPINNFVPWIPVKLWKIWNSKRKSRNLQIINPRYPERIVNPIKAKLSFSTLILPGRVVSGTGTVAYANSSTIHHNILRDDSANYGVNLTKKHNFVIVFDGITKPNEDFQSYAIIYVDGRRKGITSKGLITQRKVFRTNLPVNRHLLKVRIVIKDVYQRRWRSLINTRQPKPKYFPIKRGYITLVKVTYRPTNRYKKYAFIGRFVAKNKING